MTSRSTPLQLALAYATLANGGTVVRPHVAMSVEDPTGRVVQEINPEARRQVEIDPEDRRMIMDGLHAAAMEEGGTSYGIFGGWPIEVAGKTGTSETRPKVDQSWYVGFAPYEDPQIVVVATIEEGGFGAAPRPRLSRGDAGVLRHPRVEDRRARDRGSHSNERRLR